MFLFIEIYITTMSMYVWMLRNIIKQIDTMHIPKKNICVT